MLASMYRNLPMVKGTVAMVGGESPDFQGESLTTISKETKDDSSGVTLRATFVWKYFEKQFHKRLQEHPESCLGFFGQDKHSVKTYRWEKDSDCLTGYLSAPTDQSGKKGVFLTNLTRDSCQK